MAHSEVPRWVARTAGRTLDLVTEVWVLRTRDRVSPDGCRRTMYLSLWRRVERTLEVRLWWLRHSSRFEVTPIRDGGGSSCDAAQLF